MEALLSNVNTTTRSEAINGNGADLHFIIYATDFGGGDVALEASVDKVTWVPIIQSDGNAATFTSNVSVVIPKVHRTAWISAVFTEDGGTPDDVNVYVG